MSESILTSTKKILGIAEDYDAFDMDIIMHINSALSTLNQLGLGPEEGFMILDDSEEWGDLLEDDMRLNSIKTYVYLKVRIIFDPPSTSFVLTAMQEQIKELEWRLNAYREGRDRA
ncbi:hypothetical protein SEA_SCHWARTZ33_15 [Gordonia phage Schwartz33]|nr:hypothetical protein SEA_SCHWARTZ33_15 [Gordonia phage Schwartz33]